MKTYINAPLGIVQKRGHKVATMLGIKDAIITDTNHGRLPYNAFINIGFDRVIYGLIRRHNDIYYFTQSNFGIIDNKLSWHTKDSSTPLLDTYANIERIGS